jgi:hypothetical protein
MIWLFAHPLPPTSVIKRDQRNTGRLRKRDNLLTGEEGTRWARSRIIRQQESMVLSKSFITLCLFYSAVCSYRTGYVPGEAILFSAEVDNQSNKVCTLLKKDNEMLEGCKVIN